MATKKLTNGNKKQLACQICGKIFSWNTPDQKTVMGHRIINCPDCGAEYIVPSSQLQANFSNKMTYSQNIYNSSSSSSDKITQEQSNDENSDFSIANVTFRCTDGTYNYRGIFIYNVEGSISGLFEDFVEIDTEGITLQIPLYKGYCIQNNVNVIFDADFSSEPSVSGGVQLEDNQLIITGDGTFLAEGSGTF